MSAEPDGGSRESPWIRRVVAEMARGRHVILHGNVHDEALWNSQFTPVPQILRDVLRRLRFELIGRFDQLDGLIVEQATGGDGSREFDALLAAGGPHDGHEGVAPAQPAAAATPGGRGSRAESLRKGMVDALAQSSVEPVRYLQPRDALAAIRRALAQPHTPTAFLLDFADLLLTDPEHNDRADRDLLLLVKKAMMEAGKAPRAHVRNQLVVITTDLRALPPWLYRDEPFVHPVQVPMPSTEERQAYLGRRVHLFYQHREGQDYKEPVEVLANLTEGMALADLAGLSATSGLERLPLTSARELVNRAIFGEPVDPWARLAGRLQGAEKVLGERVLGQPSAVERVTRSLAAATIGVDFVADPHSVEARPKGVFFLAGPTGVGKTELCKALSKLIFDDETAMIRFDMSTFMEAHAAERLTGAPPGYVGHERGGELTNRVSARPFSLLLFDEIEKAHDTIFDKFLQILEDGRFTDGLGQTTYFSQTLIIFTSNAGAKPLYQSIAGHTPGQPLPTTEDVARHFEGAVRSYFTERLGRPELLGRIANGVLAFDIVRPEYVDQVTAKFLDQLVASAARKGIGLELERDSVVGAVRRHMAAPENMALGYREVRNELDRILRDPLIDAIRSGDRRGSYTASVPPGERKARVRARGSAPPPRGSS